MAITVEAIYENGVLKPSRPLTLAEGAEVRLTISPLDEDYDPLDAVIGICKEGPDISLAERHDEIPYDSIEGSRRK
ncbi:MAG TPA: antitoxin family protein [Thermoguttaceae bacterium]|nr:antitoxin family protein [Thermoguttaceae bacterium]